MRSSVVLITGAVLTVGALVLLALFLFLKPTSTVAPVQTTNGGSFATGGITSVGGAANNTTSNSATNQVAPLTVNTSQKVFKVADGPVTGATFVQTLNPTTTLVRYVLQENGHILDQAIDVSGSVARATSNTTIPGTSRAVWGNKGNIVFLQYTDASTIKTLSLTFPPAATSSQSTTRPVEIKFLPDNVRDFALSPDGKQVVYLLLSGSGTDGYIANADGSNVTKLFSLGLSELLVSWPSPTTLLLSTKGAAAAPGAVFSVDIKTGGIVPLVYANGLTAIADRFFSNIVYQATSGDTRSSYLHNIKKGTDTPLSFDPIPEKCTWGNMASTTLYCAAPAEYTSASYLDSWHAGSASLPDTVVSFIPTLNAQSVIVAVPGSSDGGVQSDILELAVSPDDRYLLFVKKGDRSVWVVRLFQQ